MAIKLGSGEQRTDEQRRQGHPTSPSVRDACERLESVLRATYGVDFSFMVCGNGHVVAASNYIGRCEVNIGTNPSK